MMSSISAKINNLIELIDEYENITVKCINASDVKNFGGLISCMTPKICDCENQPYVKLYNTTTDKFYGLLLMEKD